MSLLQANTSLFLDFLYKKWSFLRIKSELLVLKLLRW
jgi:hypothetical protein